MENMWLLRGLQDAVRKETHDIMNRLISYLMLRKILWSIDRHHPPYARTEEIQ